MSVTTSTFSAVLKEYYGPALESILNEEVVLFDALKEAGSECKIAGSGLIWPVHTGRSGGVGAVAESALLPTAGNQTRRKATVVPKEIYGRIQLSNRVMTASKGDKAAFADAMDAEMRDLSLELMHSLNRQLHGLNIDTLSTVTNANEYITGVIAECSAAGATTTTVTVTDTHFVHAGMKLRLGDNALDSATANGVTGSSVGAAGDLTTATGDDTAFAFGQVASVDSRTTFTMTWDAVHTTVPSWDATAVLTVGDSSFVSYREELTGLTWCVDDDANVDDFQGIDVSANTTWTSHVNGNSGTNRNLSHELMDAMIDGINEKSGTRPNYITGHNSAVREVKKLMEGDVRYVPLKFKGGFVRSFLTWNNGKMDVPIVSDRHCFLNKLYFLDLKAIKIGYQDKFRWLDDDGAVLSRVTNKADFEAAFGAILELLVTKRNAHGLLDDIAINSSTLITPQ